jgi:hypothetical protein
MMIKTGLVKFARSSSTLYPWCTCQERGMDMGMSNK